MAKLNKQLLVRLDEDQRTVLSFYVNTVDANMSQFVRHALMRQLADWWFGADDSPRNSTDASINLSYKQGTQLDEILKPYQN